ncbi:unnamed protein product [Prorocentrum cordatum]|uniref:Kinesin motor domain-containing protein n=1 Tax=Prorocentrum cordatum TaxID=2364126 RepID=A0ABN9UGM6_9DINO|nr:unnamed protein product [Polarella glacialis]
MSFGLDTFVRVRPNAEKHRDALVNRHLWGSARTVSVAEDAGAQQTGKATASSYGPFAAVLPPDIAQPAAYEILVSGLADSFLRSGTNCTIFAYGQTGSGKTYTLFGPPDCFSKSDEAQASADADGASLGLCPRALRDIRQAVRGDPAATTSLFVSAVEIYLEECYDLLNNKVKVPIAGASSVSKKAGGSFNGQRLGGGARSADGKWVPPVVNGKRNPALHEVEVKGSKQIAAEFPLSKSSGSGSRGGVRGGAAI